ncbi:MAG TPA: ELM1/GtrOC1 family putative glycosyltransferase [Dongiaceae bacterium]|nr:ELM1/GtrOC1 family putative glycosyltransferase [Dongiaceae bacterium]
MSIVPVSETGPARRSLTRLLPPGPASVPILVTIFIAAAAILSRIVHTRFTLPQPGEIPALHTNYWVPPIAAAIGYLVLQCLAKFFGPGRRAWRQIARHATTDYLMLAFFILILYVHFNVKMWIPVVNPRLYDQDFYAVDQALRPLLVLMGEIRGAIARILPAPDIWYQAAFFAIFVISFLSHALGRRKFHYHNIIALMLIEMIGPFSYLIAPAVGPFIFEHGPNALATAAQLKMYDVFRHVQEGGIAWIAQNGGAHFADPLAAMPSIHVGATLIIVYYAIRGRLWVAPITILALAWIVLESVVARWHYLADLPAGILLSVCVITLTNWLCRGAAAAEREEDRRGPKGGDEDSARRRPAGGSPLPAAIRSHEVAAERSAATLPSVWVLKCHRWGDHAQSLALAEALGWPFIVKKTKFHWYELFFAVAGMATLVGLNRRRSSPMTPPWPDLIILAGRQNETPAKWIRKKSGGRTRIVVIGGRNWTPPDELDCIITTAQFSLPVHRNVLHNTFPLHVATPERLAQSRAEWMPRVGNLRGPYLAVMVGGSSGPYVFSRETARRLGREASALARMMGASLLVSTSARTGKAACRALEEAIDVPCLFYRFRPDDADNPHLGFLALADSVIVTGDSMSMLMEACDTGRPVYMFEFGGGPAAMHGPRSADPRIHQWWRWSQLKDQGLLMLHYGLAISLPAWRFNRSRDIRKIQDQLVASGRVQWLGDVLNAWAGGHAGETGTGVVHPLPFEDLQRAVQRVRGLFQTERPRQAVPSARPAATTARTVSKVTPGSQAEVGRPA